MRILTRERVWREGGRHRCDNFFFPFFFSLISKINPSAGEFLLERATPLCFLLVYEIRRAGRSIPREQLETERLFTAFSAAEGLSYVDLKVSRRERGNMHIYIYRKRKLTAFSCCCTLPASIERTCSTVFLLRASNLLKLDFCKHKQCTRQTRSARKLRPPSCRRGVWEPRTISWCVTARVSF